MITNKSLSLVPTDAQKRKKSKPKPKVLDEDEYLEKLETIIQRDFFPDIAKLKAQNEYFDAVQRNDAEKIKQLQEKFSSRRTDVPINTPRSPEFFETPDIRKKNNDLLDQANSEEVHEPQPSTSSGKFAAAAAIRNDSSKEDAVINVDNITVDKFLYKYTSEDNSSFEQILDASEEKFRQNHNWMYNAETEHASRVASTLMLTNADEQLAIEGPKRASLDNWTYQAKNAVMFVPDGVEWSPDEMIQRQKMNERVIVHENTRLDPNTFGDQSTRHLSHKAATIQAAASKGKVDALGNEVGLGRITADQLNYVVTPSPAPGVNESPMMTWGEIEGTPFRLDAGDTVLPKTSGPSFKMPEIPLRDQLAQCITTEMSKKHRQKKQAALNQISARSPSFLTGTKSVERIASMSPAAQRLATAKLGIRTGTDKALKATYTPSPARIGSSKTPSLSKTPSIYETVMQSPAFDTPGKRALEEGSKTESLTDNLLNLQTKKPKAADYF